MAANESPPHKATAPSTRRRRKFWNMFALLESSAAFGTSASPETLIYNCHCFTTTLSQLMLCIYFKFAVDRKRLITYPYGEIQDC
jgi:hypothetical protein